MNDNQNQTQRKKTLKLHLKKLSQILINLLFPESWVELPNNFIQSCSDRVTPPLPFSFGEEYLRLLKEAQKESNHSSRISSRRDSPKNFSPKSPPNSPNPEPATSDEELKGVFINYYAAKVREPMHKNSSIENTFYVRLKRCHWTGKKLNFFGACSHKYNKYKNSSLNIWRNYQQFFLNLLCCFRKNLVFIIHTKMFTHIWLCHICTSQIFPQMLSHSSSSSSSGSWKYK